MPICQFAMRWVTERVQNAPRAEDGMTGKIAVGGTGTGAGDGTAASTPTQVGQADCNCDWTGKGPRTMECWTWC